MFTTQNNECTFKPLFLRKKRLCETIWFRGKWTRIMSGALPSLSACAILLSTKSRVWHPVTAATFLHLDASTRLITRSYAGRLGYRISHNLPFGCIEVSKHVDQLRRYEIRQHSMLMKFILRIHSFYAQTILCTNHSVLHVGAKTARDVQCHLPWGHGA